MGLENFKRWHWMLISLVVGALLGYAQLYDISGKRITPDEAYSDRRSIGLAVLMQKLSLPKTAKGYAWIEDLTIYPPIDGKICVAGNELQPVPGKNGFGTYRAFQQVTEVPFKRTGAEAPSPTYSFIDYVKDLKEENADLNYRVAWWANPPVTFGIWMGGSFLLIGLLFPTFISVLQGSGYIPKPAEEMKETKPSFAYNRGSHEDDSLVKAKKAAMTAQDHQQLDDLTSKLEKSLGGAATHSGTASPTGNASETPVKKLESGPVEQAAPIEAPKEDVDWGGEFYPVAHSKHHKDEEKH